MIVREVGREAADLLSAIHEECFPNYWNIETFNNFFSVDGTRVMIASSCESVSDCAESFAADRDPVHRQRRTQDDEAGAMIVWRNQHTQSDIMTLAVRPAFRRQGIAKTLLEEALAQMESARVRDIFLDVEDGNMAAIKLYEAYGFTHLRRRKLYYRQKNGSHTDALVMTKKFS